MKKSSNKGFTLVELIIVIAILAIIMLIAIPNFSGIQQRMQVRADKSTAAQIGKAVRIWYTEYNSDVLFKKNVTDAVDDSIANDAIGKKPTLPDGHTAENVETSYAMLPGNTGSTVQLHTVPYLLSYVDTTLLPKSRHNGGVASLNQMYWIGITGTGQSEKIVVSIGEAAVSLTNLTPSNVTYDGSADAVAYIEP